MFHMQNKLNINAFFDIFCIFSPFRFEVYFSKDKNLLNSTFPSMFFFLNRFDLYIVLLYLSISQPFFKEHGPRTKKCNKLYDETTCSNKICSRQRAIITGKAATLLVRIIKPSTPLPAQTMKGTVKLCFLILSFSFLALFSKYKNLARSLFPVNFFCNRFDLHSAFIYLDINVRNKHKLYNISPKIYF